MRQNQHTTHTVGALNGEEELAVDVGAAAATVAVAAYGKRKKCGISTSSRTNHKFSYCMRFPARALISGKRR